MFRRRRSAKEKIEPELVVLLQFQTRYPGDSMQGVVIMDLPTPTNLLSLEVRLVGEERATLGGLLVTDKNPEARKTVYYEQFITLRGVDHSLLQRKHSFLDGHRTVVSHDAASQRANATASAAGGPLDTTPSSSSTAELQVDLPASAVQNMADVAIPLVPGTYSYPFAVELPDTLPPSREISRAREGRCVLQYRAIATLVLSNGKTYFAETRFRIFPLPVQVQRWYKLHKNEQLFGSGIGQESSNGTDTDSRFGVMSRLMSSAGTRRIGTSDREREVACQRRLHHSWQFSEDQLAKEVAEFARTAEARAAEKERLLNGSGDRANNTSNTAAPRPQPTPPAAEAGQRPPRRSRGRRQSEAETRSLDGKDGAGGAAALDDDDAGNEVYAFELEEGAAAAAASTAASGEDEGDEQQSGDAAVPATPTAEADRQEPRRHRRRRHHSTSEAKDGGSIAAGPSALLEDNVEKIAYTPPEDDLPQLPAHTTVRPVGQDGKRAAATASPQSNVADDGESEGEDDKGGNVAEAQDRQRHRRQSTEPHTQPWNQEYAIGLRGGFMRTGKVKALLSLRSPLITVGSGKVGVKVLIDNSDGSGTITRLKYSLVTRCYIRTKTEVYNFEVTNLETSSDVSVEKGTVVKLPEVELPVPKCSPLTMVTEGMGTTTFLIVRFYVGTTLKTFSRSVETEVLLVSGQDELNCSRRLLRWTCYFRRGHGTDSRRELTQRPPIINLSDKNASPIVLDGNCSGSAMDNAALHDGGDDSTSVSPSAVSHSLRLLRTSQRVSKKAPSLDARRLAKTLNFRQAVFVPRDDDDLAAPPGHVDPLMGLNPFVAPSNDVGTTLPDDE